MCSLAERTGYITECVKIPLGKTAHFFSITKTTKVMLFSMSHQTLTYNSREGLEADETLSTTYSKTHW